MRGDSLDVRARPIPNAAVRLSPRLAEPSSLALSPVISRSCCADGLHDDDNDFSDDGHDGLDCEAIDSDRLLKWLN
jgi:hypothetical protein